jgi:hypothetical protein
MDKAQIDALVAQIVDLEDKPKTMKSEEIAAMISAN